MKVIKVTVPPVTAPEFYLQHSFLFNLQHSYQWLTRPLCEHLYGDEAAILLHSKFRQ